MTRTCRHQLLSRGLAVLVPTTCLLAAAVIASAFLSVTLRFNHANWMELDHGWISFIHWDTTGRTVMISTDPDGSAKSVMSATSVIFDQRTFVVRRPERTGLRLQPEITGLYSATMTRVSVPLLVPLAIGLTLVACCWRLRRRPAREGTCSECGYPMGGLPAAGKCPECGQTQPANTLPP
jgi:hypothetical protein